MDLYFQQIRRGLLILPGLGKNIFSHLHVTDAAELLIACAQQAYRGILPVGDDLPATWSAFLALVRLHHAGARVLVLPQWLALAAAYAVTPVRRFRPHPGLETPGRHPQLQLQYCRQTRAGVQGSGDFLVLSDDP